MFESARQRYANIAQTDQSEELYERKSYESKGLPISVYLFILCVAASLIANLDLDSHEDLIEEPKVGELVPISVSRDSISIKL